MTSTLVNGMKPDQAPEKGRHGPNSLPRALFTHDLSSEPVDLLVVHRIGIQAVRRDEIDAHKVVGALIAIILEQRRQD